MECENGSLYDWDCKVGDQVLLKKMVSSANQKVGMKVILGLSHTFFQQSNLTGYNCCSLCAISLSYTTLMLKYTSDKLLVHYTTVKTLL
jgi:hypothetical protein